MSTAAELRSLRKGLDRLRAEVRALLEARVEASRDGSVKRAVAAEIIGIGVTKLDGLIRARKLATCEDVTLIPLAEIRRYCAPKPKRQRRPAIGVRAMRRHDGQSDEAIAAARLTVREKARAGG